MLRLYIICIILVIIVVIGVTGCCLTPWIYCDYAKQDELGNLVPSVVRVYVVNKPDQLFEGIQTSTGFFCGSQGLLLTSAHVLVSSQKSIIYVELDTERVRGKLIALSEELDAALIRIELEDSTAYPPPLVFTSEAPFLGDPIFIPGFPKNDYVIDSLLTITSGSVAVTERKLNRDGRILGPLIQVDAYTSDGFSGAPVINSHGKVIGMVNYILSTNQGVWLGSTYVTPADKLRIFLENSLVR